MMGCSILSLFSFLHWAIKSDELQEPYIITEGKTLYGSKNTTFGCPKGKKKCASLSML